jgi:hypothetical protein
MTLVRSVVELLRSLAELFQDYCEDEWFGIVVLLVLLAMLVGGCQAWHKTKKDYYASKQ